MPMSAPTRCTQPGCGRIAVSKHRCASHQPEPWTSRRTSRDERDTPTWRALVGRVKADEPRCRRCGAPTAHVDHIVPVADGGAKLDRANLQGLCEECHASKTRSENQARNRARANAKRQARERAEYVDDA
jgi:5-methylcytosine-specific restriction endonuclease McrA